MEKNKKQYAISSMITLYDYLKRFLRVIYIQQSWFIWATKDCHHSFTEAKVVSPHYCVKQQASRQNLRKEKKWSEQISCC